MIAAVALLLQMVALAPPAAASVAEDSDYRFGDTFNSAVGTPPALVALERPASETGDFATETVDGAARRVFAFGTGQGLELSPTTGLVGNEYTIAMVVRQSEVSGYRKLIDFWGGTTDDGLYIDDGALHFYGLGMGSGAMVDADEWVHIVLTRTAAGTLTGYVDGEQQFTSDDVSALAVPNGASALRFFVEDGATATEESAGAIARLRTWTTALSAGDVAALAQLPGDVVVPTDHTLTVEIAGDGAGSVTRSDEGTACDPDTSACRTYPAGTEVTLTATPEDGSTFFGWGMAVPEVCSTEPYPTECTVTVDGDKTVQAVFLATADPALTVVVEGPGTVASAPAGITDCADECSATYAPGTEVTLTATPDGGATFNGWTVAHDATACAGTGTCTVTMDAARTVTASFAAANVDTDGDGVMDGDDACVNVRGSGADGCPVDRTIDTNSAIDSIMVTRDLNCASTYNGNRMFFADLACGTFLAVDGLAVYGPASVPAGAVVTPWTPWSQGTVTGTGTAADPYSVVTEVAAGDTGIRLVQTDTYVEGADEISTSMQVVNHDDAAHEVVLYRAADCYFQGSDAGFGNFVAETEAIGCREVTDGAPGDLVLEWEPGDPANSHYYESSYGSVWAAVESMTAFPNACAQCPNQVDNGAGLSWSATLAADGADGDEATRSHVLRVVERDVTAGEIPGDADVDGVPDADDLCPNTPEDPNDPNDPVRDGCPGQDDGDGIDPSVDNCPATYNVTQDDWDEDGIGDACDVVASIEDHDSGAEGSTLDNGVEVSVPVTLEEPAIGDVTLTFATISGTAEADADYIPTTTGTVTILDGEITGYATVKLIGDLVTEGDETFSIVLTNPDMEYTDDSGEVTITDDESSCDLDGDGILHVYGGFIDDLDIRRSGDDIVVSGTSINQVCGLMSAVDKIVVHGFDRGDSYPTTDVVISAADGTFTPGATEESSGLSELEIEVEHVNVLEFVGTPGNDDIRVGTTGLALNSDSDADILTTGVSAVVVSGGEGADRIYATGGRGSGSTRTARVVLNGGPGADRLIGGAGMDDLYGGDGNDTMIGGAGADWMFGNDGVDTVSYADHHYYENVTVNLADGAANDGTVDSSGNSTEMDKAEAENAIGGAGNDKLLGTDGPNKLTGGAGTDDLYGYDGNDSMTAGPGGGLLYAGGGKDRVIGGSGDDDLWGHAGDDLLYGYGGNDELHPGAGIDFVSGGADFDEVLYLYDATDATGGVGIDVGMGVGTAGIADDDMYVGLESYRGTTYSDTLIGGPDADRLHAIGGDDTLMGAGGNDFLYAGDGNDNLYGDAGFDDLYGEAGDDTFFEGSESNGSDDFIGDAGSDQVVYSYRTSPTVHSGVTDGSIQINGVVVTVDSSFNDGAPMENDRVRTDIEKVWGTQFNDKMVGQNAKDIFYGQAGQDVLEGGGGHDELNGENDGDTLRGGPGSDVLSAGSGNDDLYGDAGNDDLYGHDGNDFFGEGSSPNGSDDFIGGPGADGVDYGSRPSTHQLRLSLDNNSFDDGAYTTAGAALENDNLRTSIENVQAGAGGDLLWGNGAANKMWGGAGADQLVGYAGMDQLDGGDGVDSIWGGNHDDTLWGGNQKDYLYGEAGYDTIFGGGGSDECIGEALDSCP